LQVLQRGVRSCDREKLLWLPEFAGGLVRAARSAPSGQLWSLGANFRIIKIGCGYSFDMTNFPMKPILIDLPDAIHSERLTIRAPRLGDGRKVFEATVESLDALREFPASLPWALEDPSIEASEFFCRTGASNYIARRDFPLLFLLRESDTLIGCGGLHKPRWTARTFEVGWWGRTAFTGQGLITEAVRTILDFAFSSLAAHRVEALPDDLNEKSWRLCERVGMDFEGILRHERIAPDGVLRNSRMYSKISC
jgi:RimJ/RimL family protein N-acetyltransferase